MNEKKKNILLLAAIAAAAILLTVLVSRLNKEYTPIESSQTETTAPETGDIVISEPESTSQETTETSSEETTPEETEKPLVYKDPPQLDSEFHQATKKEWSNGWYETGSKDPEKQWQYINELGEAASGDWEWIDTDGDQTAECFYFSSDGYLVRNAEIDGHTVGENGCWTRNGEIEEMDISILNGWQRLNAMDGYFLNGWKYRDQITPDNVYVNAHGAAVTKSKVDTAQMAAESADAMIIAIDKSSHFLEVWQNGEKIRSYVITVGSAEGDKVQQGDRKTPEGTFYVCGKNPYSEYTRGLYLNYPTNEDAQRGLDTGLIDNATYEDIVEDNNNGEMPNFDTMLGGDIEIHGARDYEDNSAGCIELLDDEMIDLYDIVEVGTKVYILP